MGGGVKHYTEQAKGVNIEKVICFKWLFPVHYPNVELPLHVIATLDKRRRRFA